MDVPNCGGTVGYLVISNNVKGSQTQRLILTLLVIVK